MTETEQSLVLIKPDGVSRGLVGEIISRFEKRGFLIRHLKMMTISRETAQQHYGEHEGKSFYLPLIDFITSGSIVAMVIEGERAISIIRAMCGATDAGQATPGTIRGDFAIWNSRNVVHASDSISSALREIKLFFQS
ncbi:MAG: nucleoside-diphosphate kinase [Candidatus Margulisiibacteriota bacterium]